MESNFTNVNQLPDYPKPPAPEGPRTASTRGRASRMKGKRGELKVVNELNDLLGIKLKRRVRNHANESDITGLEHCSVEVKNVAVLSVGSWWKQTVAQAGELLPVLFYNVPHKGFRAVLPMNIIDPMSWQETSDDIDYTVEMSVSAFAVYYRETFL